MCGMLLQVFYKYTIDTTINAVVLKHYSDTTTVLLYYSVYSVKGLVFFQRALSFIVWHAACWHVCTTVCFVDQARAGWRCPLTALAETVRAAVAVCAQPATPTYENEAPSPVFGLPADDKWKCILQVSYDR